MMLPTKTSEGKCCSALNPRVADQRGQAIGQQFRKRAGILVRNHSRHRPRRSAVFGRKRSAALKKVPAAVPLKRALTAQPVLEDFRRNQAVDRGFAGQQPGFPPMLVVRGKTQQPQTRRAAHQRAHPGVGKRVVVAERLGIVRQVQADVAIGHKQSRRNSRERYQPFRIRKSQMRGTGPDLFWSSKKSFPNPDKLRSEVLRYRSRTPVRTITAGRTLPD